MTEDKNRRARFFRPPNTLKQKVGSGGLAKDILDKAQLLLEENRIDFEPIALCYMELLRRALDKANNPPANASDTLLLDGLISPIMQLKANGGMFHYPLVTKISEEIVLFLENVKRPDTDVQEIIHAYETTISAILQGEIKGDGGVKGENLFLAIKDACRRYEKKHLKA